MQSVARPTKFKCIEAFGINIGSMVHQSFLSAEFRNAITLLCQIKFVKKIVEKATVQQICFLFNISTRRYYKVLNDVPCSNSPGKPQPPSQQLLTAEEEIHIIGLIHSHQVDNDCLTSRDLRLLAAELLKIRTGEERSFSREWSRNFLRRHSDQIDKTKASAVDDDRANIDLDEVKRYIQQVEEVLVRNPNPYFLLNMDETGFGRRPEKGKRKSVLISKSCQIHPFWRECTDIHHISLVMCVTASCDYLRPMLISTRARHDSDISDTFFKRWAEYTKTEKGYQTSVSMLYWVKNVLAPYIHLMRAIKEENCTCILIIDGCSAHFSEDVKNEIDKIGDVILLPIPPHSSHLTQMLDATVFGSLKRRYGSTPSNSTITSKFTRKLLRIKTALQTCITEELIRSGWESTGFKLELVDGEVNKITFDDGFKRMLLAEASGESENQ